MNEYFNCLICKYWGCCPREGEPDCMESCPSKFATKNGVSCGGFEPSFITPEQYKERAGRDYPFGAPVHAMVPKQLDGEDYYSLLGEYGVQRRAFPGRVLLCAFGDVVPPRGWVPEEAL